MNSYIRYTLNALFGLVLLIPLVVSDAFFFPYITGKNFYFRILTEIIFGVWLIGMLYEKSLRPTRSSLLCAFTALVATMAVSTALAENPYKSFWSNFERMEGYVSILHLFAYFVALSSTLRTIKSWLIFWKWSLGISVVASFYGVSQYLGATDISMSASRLDGTFGNATYLAIYLLIHIFVAIWLAVRNCLTEGWREDMLTRYAPFVYGIVVLLELFVLYHTGTRGAILGLLGGAGLAALYTLIFAKNHPIFRKVSAGALGAVLVIVVGFIAVKDTHFVRDSQVLSRFASISLDDTTTKSRFLLWGMAFEGFKERPIFGWGQENFNYVFNKYYDPALWASEQWFDRTHNVIFDWLIAGGALGLLAYLALFVSALFALRKSGLPLPEQAVLLGLLAAYFIHNLFVFDNIVSWVLFASLLSMLAALSGITPLMGSRVEFSASTRNRIVVPLIAVATITSMWFFNAKPMGVASGLIGARTGSSGPQAVVQSFEKLLVKRSLGRPEVREQLFQVALSSLSSNTDPNVRTRLIGLADREFARQIEETPDDARYHFFYAILLAAAGDVERAGTYFARAAELSPRKQSMLLELSSNLIVRGKRVEGLEIAEKAYRFDTAYDGGLIGYASALIANGRSSEAEQLIAERFGTPLHFDNSLLRAYVLVREHSKVLAIWQKRATDIPNDPAVRLSLSAAYLEVGDRPRALATLADTLALYARVVGYDPLSGTGTPEAKQRYDAFKGQIDYYVNEIRAGRNPTN